MPAVPKSSSSTTRRQGATKQKGAVRAKSGCYTCRIRRKKCDEQADANSHCNTCSRLRLECLGFGAKRPDWLRDNENVKVLREHIKKFLGAQGMIKGHAASGPRTTDSKGVLRLSVIINGSDGDSSSNTSFSSSPPSRREPLPEDDYPRREAYQHGYGPGHHHYPPHDPGQYDHESQSPEPFTATSLVPSPSSTYCGIANSYNVPQSFYDDYAPYFQTPSVDQSVFRPPNSPAFTTVQNITLKDYVQLYSQVVPVQYLLGLRDSHRMIVETARSPNGACALAAQLLSQIYFAFKKNTISSSRIYPGKSRLLTSDDFKANLDHLKKMISSTKIHADNALAALHAVSIFLFDGGKGEWLSFLQLASSYVDQMMNSYQTRYTPRQFLERVADEKVAFIIKTSIWFDVLASVSTGGAPLLIKTIRELFPIDPIQSGISVDITGLEHLGHSYSISHPQHQPSLTPHDFLEKPSRSCMLTPMGCENIVVRVLAEISTLADAKDRAKSNGTLSNVELVSEGLKLQKYLEENPNQPVDFTIQYFENNADAYSRYLTSRIFRASAWIYLHSVISGGFPKLQEIRDAVDVTMFWIRRIPNTENLGLSDAKFNIQVRKSVVRSTVFAFFICGALTDNEVHRNLLKQLLQKEADQLEGDVGNLLMILTYLDKIWWERKVRSEGEVDWRKYLGGDEPILLV